MAHLNAAQRWVFIGIMLLLFLLVALAALVVAVGWVPDAIPAFKQSAVPALLLDIVGAVLLVWKAEFGPRNAQVFINVMFKDKTAPIVLDPEMCKYELFDSSGKAISKGRPAASLGPGGWQCRIPVSLETDTARLVLVEENGTRWRVLNFGPTTVTVEATQHAAGSAAVDPRATFGRSGGQV